MSQALMFTPVEVGEIGKTLSGFFDTEEGKEVFTRAAASNVVIAGATPSTEGKALELIEMLATAHPSRFFLPIVDDACGRIQAGVTTSCVRVSGSVSVCSEVVKISVPAAQSKVTPSLLRANFLPGLTSEVVVMSWQPSTETLIREADTCMFDSRELREDEVIRLLGYVSDHRVPTVDFNWVRLGLWREEFKRIFDRPGLGRSISRIATIVIRHAHNARTAFDVEAYLLAGWFLSRLDLEPVSFSRAGWECKARNRVSGVPVSLRFEEAHGEQRAGVTGVEVWVAPENGEAVRALVRSERAKILESWIDADPPVTLHRSVDRDDLGSVIDRYFLVGESTFNFDSAQRLGREMFELTRGFER